MFVSTLMQSKTRQPQSVLPRVFVRTAPAATRSPNGGPNFTVERGMFGPAVMADAAGFSSTSMLRPASRSVHVVAQTRPWKHRSCNVVEGVVWPCGDCRNRSVRSSSHRCARRVRILATLKGSSGFVFEGFGPRCHCYRISMAGHVLYRDCRDARVLLGSSNKLPT